MSEPVRQWNVHLTEEELRFLVEFLQSLEKWHLQGKIGPLHFDDVRIWNKLYPQLTGLLGEIPASERGRDE